MLFQFVYVCQAIALLCAGYTLRASSVSRVIAWEETSSAIVPGNPRSPSPTGSDLSLDSNELNNALPAERLGSSGSSVNDEAGQPRIHTSASYDAAASGERFRQAWLRAEFDTDYGRRLRPYTPYPKSQETCCDIVLRCFCGCPR